LRLVIVNVECVRRVLIFGFGAGEPNLVETIRSRLVLLLFRRALFFGVRDWFIVPARGKRIRLARAMTNAAKINTYANADTAAAVMMTMMITVVIVVMFPSTATTTLTSAAAASARRTFAWTAGTASCLSGRTRNQNAKTGPDR
jgi:hypothetical protein